MQASPRKELSLFDSTCIIVGIIIGVGIFETAPIVAASMNGPFNTLAVWFAGGVLALTGALCYAELATTYPREGGDFVYLRRAYGGWAGYLFGWSQLAIVRPVDIALLAFIFARYARSLYNPWQHSSVAYAAAAVVVLTIINIIGVKESKWTQNILTVIKVAGLLLIVGAGFLTPYHPVTPAESATLTIGGVQLAMILVLFTFGGWNEMAYVAAEVKKPQRNIVRALVVGTVGVTVLYLLINCAFLSALGFAGMSDSDAVAVDTLGKVFPEAAGRLVCVLICISALGSVNGLVFTGARITYAMGIHHRAFRVVGTWNGRLGTPVWSLVLQGCLSLAIIFLTRSFIDTILYSAPVVWLFFLATAVSVFVLRRKDRDIPRSYRVFGYPVTTIVFCVCCVFMLYSSVAYALVNKPVGLLVLAGVIAIGSAVYVVSERRW